MPRILPVAVLLLALTNVSAALACGCAHDFSVGMSYAGADAVFLTKVTSIRHSDTSYPVAQLDETESGNPLLVFGGATSGHSREDVTYQVMRSWKGPHRAGDSFKTNTSLDKTCGMSVRRSTVMIGDTVSTLPGQGEWLIFVHGPAPYELFYCSHSQPANTEQAQEYMEMLDALTRDNAQAL